MTLFLDSASVDDAERAFAAGLVGGITTNPALIAREGRAPEDIIAALCAVATGPVFYQLMAGDVEARRAEAARMLAVRSGQVGLKIPCTSENLALASELARAGHLVGITAVFSGAQAYLACQAGARFVLPYVGRSTRLLGDGPAIIREMRDVIDACGADTGILAASVKSPDEAVQALQAGAHALTLPLPVIEAMGQHHLSDQAIIDFEGVTDGSISRAPE
jgi:transaldolase